MKKIIYLLVLLFGLSACGTEGGSSVASEVAGNINPSKTFSDEEIQLVKETHYLALDRFSTSYIDEYQLSYTCSEDKMKISFLIDNKSLSNDEVKFTMTKDNDKYIVYNEKSKISKDFITLKEALNYIWFTNEEVQVRIKLQLYEVDSIQKLNFLNELKNLEKIGTLKILISGDVHITNPTLKTINSLYVTGIEPADSVSLPNLENLDTLTLGEKNYKCSISIPKVNRINTLTVTDNNSYLSANGDKYIVDDKYKIDTLNVNMRDLDLEIIPKDISNINLSKIKSVNGLESYITLNNLSIIDTGIESITNTATTHITGDLTITDNRKMDLVKYDNLINIAGNVNLKGSTNTTFLVLPSLEIIGNNINKSHLIKNLKPLTFEKLKTINGNILISETDSISTPELTDVNGSFSGSNLDVTMPKLLNVQDSFLVNYIQDKVISLPLLSFVKNELALTETNRNLSLPNLRKVGTLTASTLNYKIINFYFPNLEQSEKLKIESPNEIHLEKLLEVSTIATINANSIYLNKNLKINGAKEFKGTIIEN